MSEKFEEEILDNSEIAQSRLRSDNDEDYQNNALESDDEDGKSEGDYDILREDDIVGQEEGIAGYDGKTQFTPFNMKEEMEEGHFDKDGTYHWKKEKEIRDNWLENIDWVKIKHMPENEKKDVTDSEDDSTSESSFDRVAVYKKIVDFMKPGETIGKSLRRLGGSNTTVPKWKLKKMGAAELEQHNKNSKNVSDLTELANNIMFKTGNMDIYEESFEYISDLISKSSKSKLTAESDSFLDMYADDFDEKEKARMATKRSLVEESSTSVKVPRMENISNTSEPDNLLAESSKTSDIVSTSSESNAACSVSSTETSV